MFLFIVKMNNMWLFLNYFVLFMVNWNKIFVVDIVKIEVKIYFMYIVYSYIEKSLKMCISLFEI